MRYAAGHREQTRAKILRAAGKVFRRQGYHAAGVDKVMEEAGLTAGGFYAHFASKEALLAEVLAPAASGALHDEHIEYLTDRACAEAFVDRYLSLEHVVKTEDGCPLPPLVSEVARAGESVKASFEASLRGLATRLQGQDGGEVSEDRAFAVVALCVGGLGIARSVEDEALAERILAACRDLARLGIFADARWQNSARRPRNRRAR
jgi:TetR/AcrR family transcriptional regulator, transcriptional repressor for nem operon